jgi:hypothetical protein
MVRTEQKLKSHNNQLITIHNKKQSQKIKIKIKKSKQERKRARTEQTNEREGDYARERQQEQNKRERSRERKGDYLQYRPAARRRSVTEADVSSVKREREGKASFSLQTRRERVNFFALFFKKNKSNVHSSGTC